MQDQLFLNVFFCIQGLGSLDGQILEYHHLQKEPYDLSNQDLLLSLGTMGLKEYQPQQLYQQLN